MVTSRGAHFQVKLQYERSLVEVSSSTLADMLITKLILKIYMRYSGVRVLHYMSRYSLNNATDRAINA